jgi:mRNA interferase MazF
MKTTRPCVVISNNIVNQRRRTVVVIPLASSPREAPPVMVGVKCSGRPAVAMVDQVRAVAKERLVNQVEDLSQQQLAAIDAALREILELD